MYVFPGATVLAGISLYIVRLHAHGRNCEDHASRTLGSSVNWDKRARFFVDCVGLPGGANAEDEHCFAFSKLNQTAVFRDALLLYASDRWVNHDKRLPSTSLALSFLDFGDLEVQGGDGKTQREKRRKFFFMPVDDSFALSLAAGARELGAPGALAKRIMASTAQRKASGAFSIFDYFNRQQEDGIQERFAPLTDSKDIQLCIVHASAGHDSDDSAGPGGAIFIDVYGEYPIERLQKLMKDVMKFYDYGAFASAASDVAALVLAAPGSAAAVVGAANAASAFPTGMPSIIKPKQLYWFDLTSFNEL
jgi:hypothetical protein